MKLLLICSVASLAACTQAAPTTPTETSAPPTEATAETATATASDTSDLYEGFGCHPVSESGAGVMFHCGRFEAGKPVTTIWRCSEQGLPDYPRALAAYFANNPDKHFGESDPVTHNGRTCGFMVTFRAFVTEP